MNHTTSTHRVIFVLLMTASLASRGVPGSANGISAEHVLWYTKSAQKWSEEALPLGNGRLGCMIYGGTDTEQIQFNEDTLWTGDETDTGAYQAFGDIVIELGHDHPDDYRRKLNLSNAVHTITYEHKGIRYKRECFASSGADVIVCHFTADRPGAYDAKLSLQDSHQGTLTSGDNRLGIAGSLAGYVYKSGSGRGTKANAYALALEYEAQMWVRHQGGTAAVQDSSIELTNVDSFTVLSVHRVRGPCRRTCRGFGTTATSHLGAATTIPTSISR